MYDEQTTEGTQESYRYLFTLDLKGYATVGLSLQDKPQFIKANQVRSISIIGKTRTKTLTSLCITKQDSRLHSS